MHPPNIPHDAVATIPARQPDFGQFHKRACSGGRLSIVFLGGSLTFGAQATDPQTTSYRARVSQKFGETYASAHFRFWDAAIGGTGSQLAAFRLERDVFSRKPDLVFLDFTVNDHTPGALAEDKLASYESLVRRMTRVGIPLVIVIFPTKRDVHADGVVRLIDEKHREIGKSYGVPVADAAADIKLKVSNEEIKPDDLWDVADDAIHPGDAGYSVMADSVWKTYCQAAEESARCTQRESMLFAETYMSINRFLLPHLSEQRCLPEGWHVGKPNRNAFAFDFVPSRWMDSVAVARRSRNNSLAGPAPIVLTLRGENLFLFGETTLHSGRCLTRLDGIDVKRHDLGAAALHGSGRYFEVIAQGLDPAKKHRLEIVPELEPGQEIRLESLCTAGFPAEVRGGLF